MTAPVEMSFDRWSEHAKRAIGQAQMEAVRARTSRIDTQHFLLGVLETDGWGSRVLRQLRVDLSHTRDKISTLGPTREPASPAQKLAPTPGSIAMLAKAEDDAREMESQVVGTHHMVLALLDVDGVAQKVLLDMDANRNRVWTALRHLYDKGLRLAEPF